MCTDLSARSVGHDNEWRLFEWDWMAIHMSENTGFSFSFVLLVLGMQLYNNSLFVCVLLQFMVQGFDFIILVFTLLAEFTYFFLIFLFHLLHFFGIFLQIRTTKYLVRSMIRQVSSARRHLLTLIKSQTRFPLSKEGTCSRGTMPSLGGPLSRKAPALPPPSIRHGIAEVRAGHLANWLAVATDFTHLV